MTRSGSNGMEWRIVELTNSRSLAEEGAAMGHCVGSYARWCHQGMSAIFSLTADGARRATVEIGIEPLRITQARAAGNHAPDATTLQIVKHWFAETVAGDATRPAP